MRMYFPNGVSVDVSVAELQEAGVDLRRAVGDGDVVKPECGRKTDAAPLRAIPPAAGLSRRRAK